MCGIAGIVGPGAEKNHGVIQQMIWTQRHRGPDDAGVFTDTGVMLGHVRLAILDLSPAGHQPMTSPDGRFTIVHNGEVYNYLELREALAHSGPFMSETDTEVILRAYMVWGPRCVEHFVGMFSFALWDSQERTLFCARDRFGIKPLYFAEYQQCLFFASEIKAVLRSGLPRRPCLAALAAYLSQGFYDDDKETFFDGVYRVLPGHTLSVKPGQAPRMSAYYSLLNRVEIRSDADEAATVEQLRNALNDAVRLHLRADVKLGISLSGGLDSSTLMAMVDRQAASPDQIEAFSCDYPDSRYSERPWVELMARATSRRVNFSLMRPETFWRSLKAVMWYQEEPFGGVPTAAWAGFYQQTQRRGVTVILGGTGLDDILAGYRSHHLAYLLDCEHSQDARRLEAELEAYRRAWQIGTQQALEDVRRAKVGELSVMALDGSNPLRPECLTKGFAKAVTDRQKWPKPFQSALKNQMYQGLMWTKIPRALRFKDRMSMAFSRELRVPFLDHRLVELCFSLPGELLIRHGFTKYLLRQAMEGFVPDTVRWAHKRSVPTPQREWLGGPLQRHVEEVLYSETFASRGIFDPHAVRQCYAQYLAGEQANSFYIWQWLNLELWFRVFIDQGDLPLEVSPPEGFEFDALDPGSHSQQSVALSNTPTR